MLLRISATSILSLAVLAGAGLAGAHARTPYDGHWSVLIVTQHGDCDRAYRYAVRIVDGALKYNGDGSFSVSGHVSGSGKVQARISRGDQSASASGRLSGDSGSGTWKGKSPQKECGGRWEAERR